MSEKYYAFIKDNHVWNVAVFAEQNEELADSIAIEQGYDDAVWCDTNAPAMYSEYKNGEFLEPDIDYLYNIGISPFNKAMIQNIQ